MKRNVEQQELRDKNGKLEMMISQYGTLWKQNKDSVKQ
jgi:hypothetical protein